MVEIVVKAAARVTATARMTATAGVAGVAATWAAVIIESRLQVEYRVWSPADFRNDG